MKIKYATFCAMCALLTESTSQAGDLELVTRLGFISGGYTYTSGSAWGKQVGIGASLGARWKQLLSAHIGLQGLYAVPITSQTIQFYIASLRVEVEPFKKVPIYFGIETGLSHYLFRNLDASSSGFQGTDVSTNDTPSTTLNRLALNSIIGGRIPMKHGISINLELQYSYFFWTGVTGVHGVSGAIKIEKSFFGPPHPSSLLK